MGHSGSESLDAASTTRTTSPQDPWSASRLLCLELFPLCLEPCLLRLETCLLCLEMCLLLCLRALLPCLARWWPPCLETFKQGLHRLQSGRLLVFQASELGRGDAPVHHGPEVLRRAKGTALQRDADLVAASGPPANGPVGLGQLKQGLEDVEVVAGG
jgi:hypothetical protein